MSSPQQTKRSSDSSSNEGSPSKKPSLASRVGAAQNSNGLADGQLTLTITMEELFAREETTLPDGSVIRVGDLTAIVLKVIASHPTCTGSGGSNQLANLLKRLEEQWKTLVNRSTGRPECFGKPMWLNAVGNGTATLASVIWNITYISGNLINNSCGRVCSYYMMLSF